MRNVPALGGVLEDMNTRLRNIVSRLRSYHRRQSLEWTRRIEAPSHRR